MQGGIHAATRTVLRLQELNGAFSHSWLCLEPRTAIPLYHACPVYLSRPLVLPRPTAESRYLDDRRGASTILSIARPLCHPRRRSPACLAAAISSAADSNLGCARPVSARPRIRLLHVPHPADDLAASDLLSSMRLLCPALLNPRPLGSSCYDCLRPNAYPLASAGNS